MRELNHTQEMLRDKEFEVEKAVTEQGRIRT
jgi:hypothetical protein